MRSITLLAAVAISIAIPATAQAQTVRAQFQDLLTDRVRSDGNFSPCGVDYVDQTATCLPSTANDRNSSSNKLSAIEYYLRTVEWCCDTDPSGPVNNPSRWLVLDFSEGISGMVCPELDTALSAYPGRSPNAVLPLNSAPCTSNVAVRLFADQAFHKRAQETPVRISIDGPDLVTSRQGVSRTQWNTKFWLNLVMSIIRNSDGSVVTLTNTGTDDDRTAVLTNAAGTTVIGTYEMPFTVTLTVP